MFSFYSFKRVLDLGCGLLVRLILAEPGMVEEQSILAIHHPPCLYGAQILGPWHACVCAAHTVQARVSHTLQAGACYAAGLHSGRRHIGSHCLRGLQAWQLPVHGHDHTRTCKCTQAALMRLLAAVLWLSNLEFVADDTDANGETFVVRGLCVNWGDVCGAWLVRGCG